MSDPATEGVRAEIARKLDQLHLEIGQIRTRLMVAQSGADKDRVALELRQQERRIAAAELEITIIEMAEVAGHMQAYTDLLTRLTGFLALGQAVKNAVDGLPKGP